MAFGNQLIPLFQQAAAASPTASLSPASKSKLLADMMSMPQPKTPQSWGEGLADALNMGLRGYFDTRSLRQGELDKQAKANALADALFGKPDPNSPNVADPRHDQIAAMLTNGTLDPSALSPMLINKMGLAEPKGTDYQYTTVNGTVVRINKVTGETQPVYSAPNGNDAFTLSPGQTRYGPDGKPIANAADAPKPPEPFTLNQGDVRYGPDGKPIANNPKPTPVAPREFTDEDRARLRLKPGTPGYFDENGAPHLLAASGTTINNVGNIPPGYAIEYDSEGRPVSMSPVPGSPAAQEAAAAAAKAANTDTQVQRTADVVTDTIDRTVNDIEANPAGTTGLGGTIGSVLPGSQAQAVAQRLETIKANIGFDKLQQMRLNSPTGGALGQVSNFENRLLQATYGSLVQSQGSNEILYNLRRIRSLYAAVTGGDANSSKVAAIGQAVDAGKLSEQEGQRQIDAIFGGGAPDTGVKTLPGGVTIQRIQ